MIRGTGSSGSMGRAAMGWRMVGVGARLRTSGVVSSAIFLRHTPSSAGRAQTSPPWSLG